MRWLVRLVTVKNGTVLDPFAGSGTTGEAAMLEGMRSILIEYEPTNCHGDARRRIEQASNELDVTSKRKVAQPAWDELPLFGGPRSNLLDGTRNAMTSMDSSLQCVSMVSLSLASVTRRLREP